MQVADNVARHEKVHLLLVRVLTVTLQQFLGGLVTYVSVPEK